MVTLVCIYPLRMVLENVLRFIIIIYPHQLSAVSVHLLSIFVKAHGWARALVVVRTLVTCFFQSGADSRILAILIRRTIGRTRTSSLVSYWLAEAIKAVLPPIGTWFVNFLTRTRVLRVEFERFYEEILRGTDACVLFYIINLAGLSFKVTVVWQVNYRLRFRLLCTAVLKCLANDRVARVFFC
jgi:hypothetical protein